MCRKGNNSRLACNMLIEKFPEFEGRICNVSGGLLNYFEKLHKDKSFY